MHVRDGEPVLEIGSGSFGLAHFYHGRIVGCDLSFPDVPSKNMLPVRCSGTRLPFADSSFEAVVASDVLEHVPPDARSEVINEALRVARKLAVFAFPCGKDARALDEKFLSFYRKRGAQPPPWLEEHMQFAFPEGDLFRDLGGSWEVDSFGNEHLRFHEWVNHREISYTWNLLFQACLRLAPGLVEAALRWADRAPFYRMIFVVSRRTSQGVENHGRIRTERGDPNL